MGCLICRDMERTIESMNSEYLEARFAAYYLVCTKLAARKKVDLERAKSELEEHQLICAARMKVSALSPPRALLGIS